MVKKHDFEDTSVLNM